MYALGGAERVRFKFGEVFVVVGRILVSECGTAREDHIYEILSLELWLPRDPPICNEPLTTFLKL